MQPRPIRRKLRDFAIEDGPRSRIFVTDVDVDIGSIDDMRTDQHALDETMRIGLEIIAVLERTGFALVAVHGHQPRPGLAEYGAPFATGWKARAAETSQRGVIKRFQQILLGKLAGTYT